METIPIKDVLAQLDFAKSLQPEHLELISGCASNHAVQAGEYLFKENERAEYLYIVRAGRIAVQTEPVGRPPVTIMTAGPEDVFGWSWLFPPRRWHFDAKALETTRVIRIDGICLVNKCEEDFEFGYQVLKQVSRMVVERLESTRTQLVSLFGS